MTSTRKVSLPLTRKVIVQIKKNYLVFFFALIILFIGSVITYKIIYSKSEYMYVQVKVGEGYWWASTLKPSIWYVNAIRKGEKAQDLLGRTTAQIIAKRIYPTWTNDQYDTYITMKLRVSYNAKTKEYSFENNTVSIGSPIEVQFPKADVTGTIIDLGAKPLSTNYVEKTVYLVDQGGYTKDFTFRYDGIKVGDSYFDGQDTVFTVLSKRLDKNIWTVTDNNAQVYERDVYTTQNIVVKARIKVQKEADGYYFGKDYKLSNNASIPFSTPGFIFEGFVVREIQ